MKKILICILALLGFNFQGCKDKNNKEMRTNFHWQPSIAAPRNFPVEIKYGFIGFGTNGRHFPIMETSAGGGIAQDDSAIALNDYNDKGGLDMPNSLDILWLSYAEAKFYKARAEFSSELQEKTLNLFREEYYESTADTYYRYNVFVVTMLPGGKIWLHLSGPGRTVLVCDTLQGEEVRMGLDDFVELAHKGESVKAYSTRHLSDYRSVTSELNKQDVPYGLWDKYAERFRYKIKIEFENEKTRIDPNYGYDFTNGESFYSDDGIQVDEYARISGIVFVWKVDDTVYTGHFYFNEEEVLKLFSMAYGKNRDQQGEFIIRVSKYNNWFDIYLKAGDKEVRFEKTKIHVFKQRIDESDFDAVVFYDNHREEHPNTIQFIGE